MYHTKIIDRNSKETTFYQSTWLITETVRYTKLHICERAVLKSPEGTFLTLTVNGVGRDIKPGTYQGDVVLSVTNAYAMGPHGLMKANQISRDFHTAVVLEDGKVAEDKCVAALLADGSVTGEKVEGLTLYSNEECFNGILVTGDTECVIKDVTVGFEGFGDNDFLGVGSAVAAIDHSKVTIEDCDFTVNGVTRCAIHAGGDSHVTVRNTRVTNQSPDTHWLGSFTWQLGVRGSNRLVQLRDNANVTYDNCDLKSNGWGVCSIDGTWESCRLVIKDSRMELSGPRSHGYGAFCIGENEVIFDNCDVKVNGYPLMLMGMEGLGKSTIQNSRIRGRHFGVFVVSDDNSVLDIKGSDFVTGKSALCIKGSSTIINVEKTSMKPGNGTIVQLMDTEESGMNVSAFHVPVGVEDTAMPERDLSTVSPTEDVTLNFIDCQLEGNLYNSTTNIRAYRNNEIGTMGEFHDTIIGIRRRPDGGADNGAMMEPVRARHNGDDLRGPKNMGVNLKGSQITGIISSAGQAYREGLTRIDESNREELSNVTQWAAPTVNNGVVVSLDSGSAWTLTGTCYITGLTLADGAVLKAAGGKRLSMTVDGVETPVQSGAYIGKIVLSVS